MWGKNDWLWFATARSTCWVGRRTWENFVGHSNPWFHKYASKYHLFEHNLLLHLFIAFIWAALAVETAKQAEWRQFQSHCRRPRSLGPRIGRWMEHCCSFSLKGLSPPHVPFIVCTITARLFVVHSPRCVSDAGKLHFSALQNPTFYTLENAILPSAPTVLLLKTKFRRQLAFLGSLRLLFFF